MFRLLIVTTISCAVLGTAGCSEEPGKGEGIAGTDSVGSGTQPEMELPPGQSLSGTPRSPDVLVSEPIDVVVADVEPTEDPPSETPDTEVPDRTGESSATEPDQDPPRGPAVPASIVRDVVAFYTGLKGIRVTSQVSSRVVDDRGMVLPNTATPPQIRELIIQRPNRFSIQTDARSLPRVAYDGSELTAFLPSSSKYLKLPAAQSLDQLIADEVVMEIVTTIPTQLIPFYLMSAESRVLPGPGISDAEFVAMEEIDGLSANRLRLVQEGDFVWDLWVAAEGDPLLLQASMNRGTRTVSLPGRGDTEITIMLVEKLSDWELDPEVADDDFIVEVPNEAAEAQDVADFFEEPPDPDDE